MMNFLYDCIPFTETTFDYLVVLCRNSQGEILPTGFRVSRDFFVDLRQLIDTNNEDLAEKFTPPFPIDITAQMLECFEGEYRVLSPIVTGYEGIDKVGELLWAYSKTLELLTDECDTEYRDSSSDNLKSEILNLLASFKQKISQYDYDELCLICEDVLSGQVFDDASFKEFYEKIILEYKYSL